MYEDQTSQVIEKRMLDAVSSAVDKREGSIIHDATIPVSIELELMYAALDWFMKNTFGEDLCRIKQQGRSYVGYLLRGRWKYQLGIDFPVTESIMR